MSSRAVIGSTPTKALLLKNPNPIAMSIGAITPEDPVHFQATGCTNTQIPANGNCTAILSFSPDAAGTRSSTVSIEDEAVGSPQTIKVTGKGV